MTTRQATAVVGEETMQTRSRDSKTSHRLSVSGRRGVFGMSAILAAMTWSCGGSTGAGTSTHSAAPAQPCATAVSQAPDSRSATPATAPSLDLTPPKLRLGDNARPLGYQIDLTLVPEQDTFDGRVAIDIMLTRATRVVWLNATELTFERAAIAGEDSEAEAVRVVQGDEAHIALVADAPVGPGKVTVTASYRGVLPSHEEGGLFRRKEGDFWYIYSQLEPLDARRVFPSFDDPRFKVSYQLTLRVKKDHLALANTPIASESTTADGMRVVRFLPTPPLPSYLVAMAVGPFEVVDAGTAGRKNTPIRIIKPHGMGAWATYAAESTGPLLTLIEDYFDQPYPFAKLDQIAVPSFLGAMENPGLVTYHKELILAEPGRDSIARQRSFASICAHELAHLWFGDLVTMKWWDDLWLNESFATWMAAKIVHTWQPSWGGEVGMVKGAGWSMRSDSLDTARKIRQPIVSAHDIDNAFDGITYGKGAAVLRMFEAWIGEDKFRQGIRRYINRHARGNADASDFLAAFGSVVGTDVAAAFETFIDQPGVPVVRAELQCTRGQKPTLTLSQRRFAPSGSRIDTDRQWQLPVCVEYGVGRKTGRSCVLMTEKQAQLELAKADRCPDWVLPNDNMTGYYR
ncbi:MAG: M1 family metallopeptidase, partial [Myxococcota bacterium]